MSLKKTILLLIIGVAWIANGVAQKAANSPLQNKLKSANIMYVNYEYAEVEQVYGELMLKGALNDQEKSQYAEVLLRMNKPEKALLVLDDLSKTTLLAQGVELDCYLY
ncbi:MAG: hypothetical protein PF444_01250, partial [Bacteroidales bacterium]|nr:hypothetical protein [Bacteroidales bacterium]